MKNYTITVDEKNGKLLLIAREPFKKYVLRDDKAAKKISEIASNMRITKLAEFEDVSFIRCDGFDVAISAEDERIFNYTNILKPLIVKAEYFDKKNNQNQIANQVKRQNELNTHKVVSHEYNPRSEEYKKVVKELEPSLLEKIILSKTTEKVMKGVGVIVGLALMTYAGFGIRDYLNPNEKTSGANKETTAYTEVVTEEYSQPKILFETTNITEEANPIDEHVIQEGEHVEMDSSKVHVYPEKADKCQELYGDYINETAEKYGIPANMLLSIATQECGVHKVDPNRDAKGLFQIRASIYVGYEIKNFNYITNEWETYKITLDDLCDVKGNIDIAARICQENYLRYSQKNPVAATMCYHFGPGGLKSIANSYIEDNKLRNPEQELTSQSVFGNMDNFKWLNNVQEANKNYDLYYLQRILAYTEYFNGNNFEYAFRNPDGTVNVADFNEIKNQNGIMSFNVGCLTDTYNNTQNYSR